jgi:hypothetical protein
MLATLQPMIVEPTLPPAEGLAVMLSGNVAPNENGGGNTEAKNHAKTT